MTSFPRTQLERAPAASDPSDARLNAYNELRPVKTNQMLIVHRSFAYQGDESLVLASGRTIRHPGDLTPVIDPKSLSAEAIARFDASYEDGKDEVQFGWVAEIAGCILGGASIAGLAASSRDGDDRTLPTIGVVVGAAAVIGGVVAVFKGALDLGEALRARTDAFNAYDAGLRQRLDLCFEGTSVVPCERPKAPPVTGTRATESG